MLIFPSPHNELIGLAGQFTLVARSRSAGQLRVVRAPNLVTTVGRTEVSKYLAGEAPDPLAYLEVGTGATAPTAEDTDTETAVARSALADTLRVGTIVQVRASFIASAVDDYLKEVSIWLGGSLTLGTGVMYARALIDLDNSDGDFDVVAVYQTRVLQVSGG